jgi:hypothetical protein
MKYRLTNGFAFVTLWLGFAVLGNLIGIEQDSYWMAWGAFAFLISSAGADAFCEVRNIKLNVTLVRLKPNTEEK